MADVYPPQCSKERSFERTFKRAFKELCDEINYISRVIESVHKNGNTGIFVFDETNTDIDKVDEEKEILLNNLCKKLIQLKSKHSSFLADHDNNSSPTHSNQIKFTQTKYVLFEDGYALEWIRYQISDCSNEMTYVEWMVRNKDTKSIKYLVSRGLNKDLCKNELLIDTAKFNAVEIARYIINELDVEDLKNNIELGNKLIYISSGCGAVDTLKFFVSKGAKPNDNGKDLHNAACKGYLECVKVLVEECGTGVSGINEFIIADTVIFGHIDVAEYLISNGIGIPLSKTPVVGGQSILQLVRMNTVNLKVVKWFRV